MRYLVKLDAGFTVLPFAFTRGIFLENIDELKELLLLLPNTWEIESVQSTPIYETLQDLKEELLKQTENDIEMGKLTQDA